MLLLAFANEQSEEKAHEVGPHADNRISLIVNVVFSPGIEDLVWLEEDVLTLKDSKAHNYGNKHDQSEEDVTERLLGAVYDEERCSEESEEDVGLHHPQPRQAGSSIELQATEYEPNLINHR